LITETPKEWFPSSVSNVLSATNVGSSPGKGVVSRTISSLNLEAEGLEMEISCAERIVYYAGFRLHAACSEPFPSDDNTLAKL
jgi:hypothetical protein